MPVDALRRAAQVLPGLEHTVLMPDPVPRCADPKCLAPLEYQAVNHSWACPRTIGPDGVPRPNGEHTFFLDAGSVR